MQENKIQAGNTEQVLLSKKNCHRALKVVNIVNPEQGEWLFSWRGKKLRENLMHCDITLPELSTLNVGEKVKREFNAL